MARENCICIDSWNVRRYVNSWLLSWRKGKHDVDAFIGIDQTCADAIFIRSASNDIEINIYSSVYLLNLLSLRPLLLIGTITFLCTGDKTFVLNPGHLVSVNWELGREVIALNWRLWRQTPWTRSCPCCCLPFRWTASFSSRRATSTALPTEKRRVTHVSSIASVSLSQSVMTSCAFPPIQTAGEREQTLYGWSQLVQN